MNVFVVRRFQFQMTLNSEENQFIQINLLVFTSLMHVYSTLFGLTEY